jgi:hypothetical protein
MRTLRAFDHIESVECVTVQVRLSHSRDGAAAEADAVADEVYLVGDRRVMESEGAGAPLPGVAIAIVSQ